MSLFAEIKVPDDFTGSYQVLVRSENVLLPIERYGFETLREAEAFKMGIEFGVAKGASLLTAALKLNLNTDGLTEQAEAAGRAAGEAYAKAFDAASKSAEPVVQNITINVTHDKPFTLVEAYKQMVEALRKAQVSCTGRPTRT